MVWNGYNGNIYITSAYTLPNFHRPRVLIKKDSDTNKKWYPNLISKDLGDRLGDRNLHIYYRDFPEGPGKGYSLFRKVTLTLEDTSLPNTTTTTTTPSTTTTTTLDPEDGCPWSHSSPMFLQQENTSYPAASFNVTLGEITTVPDTVGWPLYKWMPDGHISAVLV